MLPKKASELELENLLEPENDFGNIEYKIHIINLERKRFNKLMTQIMWRTNEGNGMSIYYIGVSDDGRPQGISRKYMKESLENIEKIVKKINHQYEIIHIKKGLSGGFCVKIAIHNNNSNISYY